MGMFNFLQQKSFTSTRGKINISFCSNSVGVNSELKEVKPPDANWTGEFDYKIEKYSRLIIKYNKELFILTQSLKGKVAIITGAGRGIGKATAIALANEGVNLGLLATNESNLQEVAKEIEGLGVQAAYAAIDVSSLDQVQAAIEKITNELGKTDILINSAGVGKFASLFRYGA